MRRLADWSPRCRLRRASTATGSVAYAVAASNPVASRTSSSHGGIPLKGTRKSAVGRWVCVGFADGMGETGPGSVAAGAAALAALLADGAAIAATGLGACDVAAAAGAVVLALGTAVDSIGVGACEAADPVGATDALVVAAPVGAAAGRVAVVLGVVAAGDVWPPEEGRAADDWPSGDVWSWEGAVD